VSLSDDREMKLWSTDSKGRYLRELYNSDIEREIIWWDYSGRTTSKGYSWLVDNLDRQITHLDNVHVYIDTF
jgi:hypothetical protein